MLNYMIDKQILAQRLNVAYNLLRAKGILHTVSDFADAIKKPQPHISQALKADPKRCTLGLLTRVADTFPDVLNRDYLLKGEGDVAAPDRTMRPHYEATAAAGFMSGLADPESGTLRPRIPDMPAYDFTIDAQGDSMLPEIKSGDTLLCRLAEDRANPPIGKVCVIDGKDGAAVKVLAAASESGRTLTLHSLNPAYRDYTVDTAEVSHIAVVVAILRKL